MKLSTPTIFIILGATGDLMQRKIAPAFFNLYQRKALPPKFKVIGVARGDFDDESYRDFVKSTAQKRVVSAFLENFHYCRGDLNKLETYQCVRREVAAIDREWRVCSNKLFYLAIFPELYKITLQNLARSGLTKPCGPTEGWTRILVEKPFGKNLQEAKALDTLLGKLFKEIQVYRIDHYLSKEMVRNILNFRFSNNLFEGIWSNKFIEKIDIRLWEKIGVEDRGEFYEGLGALRDVGQNHLLQMLALTCMENPGSFDADAIRTKRAELLKQVCCLAKDDIVSSTFRAQYKGYRLIIGVKPDSNTETYFKIKTFIDSPRWRGVPIYLESGKRLGEIRKEIVVTLRHPIPCLLCPPGISEHYKNQIKISWEPKEEIKVYFWVKKPGEGYRIERQSMTFLLRDTKERAQYVEEYEQLLLDAAAGDQVSFVSTEEVGAMWKFIDPIVLAWQKNAAPLRFYKPDTLEPIKMAEEALRRSGLRKPTEARPPLSKAVGIVGLGKMGLNMAQRLSERGWRVVGFDKKFIAANEFGEVKLPFGKVGLANIEIVRSLEDLIAKLPQPKILWLMVPAGRPVDEIISALSLSKGDIIIDGGNSYYQDSARRHRELKAKGIHFLDLGVSGGPGGARHGACLMVGGEEKIFKQLEPLFRDLAVENGYQFFPGEGAGHFVKMIHNGIEYGMMQAIAEGFNMLRSAEKRGLNADRRGKIKYKLDLARIADVYNHGSVIESRLIGWLKESFDIYGDDLKKVSGKVGHTGEGEWTVKTAKEMRLKAKIIEGALQFRKQSAKNPNYTGKILAALRNRFGGHAVAERRKL